jgi:hypothetical protein
MNTNRIRYNYKLLQDFCKENNIELLCDYSNINLLRDSIIEGKCKTDNCNEICSKRFRGFIATNCYCIYHTKSNLKEKREETIIKKYGVKNAFQSNVIKQKIENSIINKYGVKNISQSEEIKDKKVETSLRNYGVNHPTQTQEIQEKREETIIKKYGVKNAFQSNVIKQKIENSIINKYGVKNISQSEEIKAKKVDTSLRNYGVKYPTQNPIIAEIASKNAYKIKEYTLPSGNIIKIQGYENYALDELLRDGILEEDIINGCSNVPEIWYVDELGIKHRHYVDIFIKSENKCIEIKSTWTAEKKKDCIFLKQQAGKELGYNYEIWIYNGKGEKVECYK